MGLALCRQHRWNELHREHEPALSHALGALHDAATPDTEEYAGLKDVVHAAWEAMNAPDAVYYDSMGVDMMRNIYRLDWAHILTPRIVVTDDGAILTPDKARDLLAFVEALKRPRDVYYRAKYDHLISFLRGAIDADDPIRCSW